MKYRYSLEKYRDQHTKHTCPKCEKRKTFTYYIDNVTGHPISPLVGKCDRVNQCGYHKTPRQYFIENGTQERQIWTPPPIVNETTSILETSFMANKLLKQSLKNYEKNNFILFLESLFARKEVERLIKEYLIGTSDYWPGSVIFWQVDSTGRIRTGQIILYDKSTGKRVKEPFNHITWCHKAFKCKGFNLEQCLFGEHLLNKYPKKPVAIVESPKSGVIASAFLPQYVWLASGGLQNLTERMCKAVKGRKVFLFPDLDGLDNWREKANHLGFQINDIMNHYATVEERKQGFDIADFLINQGHQEIVRKGNIEVEKQDPLIGDIEEKQDPINGDSQSSNHLANWDMNFQFPTNLPTSICLKPGELITDLPKFIAHHLSIIERNKGNRTFLPYLERLNLLQRLLNQG